MPGRSLIRPSALAGIMTAKENALNGMDVGEFSEYVEEVRLDPSEA